jgi:serine/threonine protein kinase
VAPYGLGWCWFGQLLLRMLRAAEHLISHDLVHGDIKDDQFFLADGGGKVVLGDFGTAWKLVDEDGVPAVLGSRNELVDRRAGVGRYKAPEVRGRTRADGHPELRQVYAKAEAFSVGVVMMDVLGALTDGDVFERLCSTHLVEERHFESGQPGSRPDDPTYGRKQPGWIYAEGDIPPLPAGCPGWLSRVVVGLLKVIGIYPTMLQWI